MTATLQELLSPQTVEQVFSTLLGVYQGNGFPVQSWQPGGTERTRAMAIATAINSVSGEYIPNIAAGGFLDYAELLTSPDWLQLLAQQLYEITFNAAAFTRGNITLTAASGVPTQTYAAGKLIAVFAASGNRYISNASITVPVGPGSVVGSFTAEFAGAKYVDPSNSGALTLATPIPGVTLTNPATNYSDVAHVGAGTGTLTLGGSPIGSHQVVILIDSTGASGVAQYSYAIDGAPYVANGVTSPVTNLAGLGINVTFVDGGSGTSFAENDTYLFSTPGSWITAQGADLEANTALAQRCRNRWSTLSPIPTNSFYELIATSTPGVGSQVTQVRVVPDTVINNRVNIVVAGPAGALPVDTIAAIQTYIQPRVPITDNPTVISPSSLAVTIAGIVTAYASQLAAAQNAITIALDDYVLGVGINGTVRISAVIELIMQIPGVIDVSGVTINGADANLVMGSSTTFVIADVPTLSLGYVTQ